MFRNLSPALRLAGAGATICSRTRCTDHLTLAPSLCAPGSECCRGTHHALRHCTPSPLHSLPHRSSASPCILPRAFDPLFIFACVMRRPYPYVVLYPISCSCLFVVVDVCRDDDLPHWLPSRSPTVVLVEDSKARGYVRIDLKVGSRSSFCFTYLPCF